MNKRTIISAAFFVSALTLYHCFAVNPEPATVQTTQKKTPSCPYFDTKELDKYATMCQRMKDDGFVEGFFKTGDNLNINYLYLERPNAEYTVILCGGWFPGRKEGLATFYKIFPDNCNLLFFDARGHGKSTGSFLGSVWTYGQHEYKDIIGALVEANRLSNKPILIYGTCAGAFHASHALIRLKELSTSTDFIEKLQIKGLIFDSGWGSVATASYNSPKSFLQDLLLKKMAGSGKQNKQEIQKQPLFQLFKGFITATSSFIHTLLFRPLYFTSYTKTNLFDKMHKMPVPVLFIHSTDDYYAPFKDACALAQETPRKVCWWITEPSKHTYHHLKFTDEYKKYVADFIDQTVLPSDNN